MMFMGSISALITPMQQDGGIDTAKLAELVEWHIASGTNGLVILGTTGESPTINQQERAEILRIAVTQARNRIPVIAGTGNNCTSEAVAWTKHAKSLKVDACLVVAPYYNKPTQEGLYQHYEAIAKAVAIPIILYNVPGRAGCDLLPKTVARLSKIANIVGIKEAVNTKDRMQELLSLREERLDFCILSGDDETALQLLLAGGQGVISVTANVVPQAMQKLCAYVAAGNYEAANKLDHSLQLLHKRLFIESNPIPVKWAMASMGLIATPNVRLPLTVLSEEKRPLVKEALQTLNL